MVSRYELEVAERSVVHWAHRVARQKAVVDKLSRLVSNGYDASNLLVDAHMVLSEMKQLHIEAEKNLARIAKQLNG